MNIVMMTNTYLPHVGGVAQSVQGLSDDMRALGHRVIIVAPAFPQAQQQPDVLRLKAWQGFNGSDFSVIYPFQGSLIAQLKTFQPHIIHSHHPFLMGQKALQLARHFKLPLVFTHHTLYPYYTHYLPWKSPWWQGFAEALARHYANNCHAVIAPSASLKRSLYLQKGPWVQVIPTGVELSRFQMGSGSGFRRSLNLPEKAFVVGHIGRLAPEKNLPFLAQCLSSFIQQTPNTFALIAGQGPLASLFEDHFHALGLSHRLRLLGPLKGSLLISAYKAMDVFAFSSLSETQGLVVLEAQAAGVPVVALGCDVLAEVIHNGHNGLLVPPQPQAFIAALHSFAQLTPKARNIYHKASLECAEGYPQRRFTLAMVNLYQQLLQAPHPKPLSPYWPCLLKAAWHACSHSPPKPLQARLQP